MDARLRRQSSRRCNAPQRTQLVVHPDDPGRTPNSVAANFSLWRCYWVKEGQTKHGAVKGPSGAKNEMLQRLEEDLPAWIVPVPSVDDDIPF